MENIIQNDGPTNPGDDPEVPDVPNPNSPEEPPVPDPYPVTDPPVEPDVEPIRDPEPDHTFRSQYPAARRKLLFRKRWNAPDNVAAAEVTAAVPEIQ